MIRIAFVVHGMQPGGIERSVTRIIAGLDRSRFSPVVICLNSSGPAAAWLPSDVPVVEIKKRSGNDLHLIMRLTSVLREYEIELVQSHNWGTLVETTVARKLAKVRAHLHAERGTVLGSVDDKGWKNRCRALAMRTALGTVNQVMSNAHSVAQRVQSRCGYPAKRIAIVPNGVRGYSIEGQDQTRQQIRKQLGIPVETLLVGSVGRLHKVKGFDVLIEAMALLRSSAGPIHLVLVGEGDQRGLLENLIKQKQVEGFIHLVGHQDEVAPWILALDVYVNSSRSEGMSQSIVEAMSVGLPIVATDVGDAKRMLEFETASCGLVCSPEKPQPLADAIAKVIDDDDLREQYGKTASQFHRMRYDEVSFSRSIRNLYFKTLGVEPQSMQTAGGAE